MQKAVIPPYEMASILIDSIQKQGFPQLINCSLLCMCANEHEKEKSEPTDEDLKGFLLRFYQIHDLSMIEALDSIAEDY